MALLLNGRKTVGASRQIGRQRLPQDHWSGGKKPHGPFFPQVQQIPTTATAAYRMKQAAGVVRSVFARGSVALSGAHSRQTQKALSGALSGAGSTPVQLQAVIGNGTSTVITPTKLGTLLVALWGDLNASAVGTISDDRGNVWTKATQIDGFLSTGIAWAVAGSTLATTISTSSAPVPLVLRVYEFDKCSGLLHAATSGAGWNANSIPMAAGDVVVAVGSRASSGGLNPIVAGSPWTDDPTANNAWQGGMGYMIPGAQGTATPNWTWTDSGPSSSYEAIAAFTSVSTPTFKQRIYDNALTALGGGAFRAAAVPGAIASGDTLVVAIPVNGNTANQITSVTDDSGNTYARAVSQVDNNQLLDLEIWVASGVAAASAGTNRVVATSSSGAVTAMEVAHFVGTLTASVVDTTGAATDPGNGLGFYQTSSFSTGSANEAIYAAAVKENTDPVTTSPSQGYTLLSPGTSAIGGSTAGFQSEWRVASAASSYVARWEYVNNRRWVMAAVALKPLPPVGLSGAMAKIPNKALGGTLSLSGALSRQVGKTLSGAISLVGALATLFISGGGGTTFTQTLTASLSLSGALVRQPQKLLAGQVSLSGALVRMTLKALAGSVSTSGALSRQAQKTLAGSSTLSGALVRQPGKLLAGSVTMSGALSRQVGKLLGGSVSLAGSVLRLVARTLAGSVPPAGALSRQTQRTLGGSVALSGALVRQAQKVLGGTVALSGALSSLKTFLRTLTGSVSLSGALSRQTQKSLAGSTSLSGALVRSTAKTLAGSVSLAGALFRQTAKTLGGTVALSGALSAIRTFLRTLTGSLSLSGTLSRQTRKTLAGQVSLSAALVRTTARVLGGSVSLAGALARTTSRTLGGTVALSGALVRSTRKVLTGSISLVGALLTAAGTIHLPAVIAFVNPARLFRLAVTGAARLVGIEWSAARTLKIELPVFGEVTRDHRIEISAAELVQIHFAQENEMPLLRVDQGALVRVPFSVTAVDPATGQKTYVDPSLLKVAVKPPGLAQVNHQTPGGDGYIVRDGVGLYHIQVDTTPAASKDVPWTVYAWSTGTVQDASKYEFFVDPAPVVLS